VERLRIELSGKRLDLRLVDEVGGAGEAPAGMQVFEIKPLTFVLQLAWFRHGPPPSLDLVTCIMIVTILYCVNATQAPRQHAVPDRP
jgi:hypothetical protein